MTEIFILLLELEILNVSKKTLPIRMLIRKVGQVNWPLNVTKGENKNSIILKCPEVKSYVN